MAKHRSPDPASPVVIADPNPGALPTYNRRTRCLCLTIGLIVVLLLAAQNAGAQAWMGYTNVGCLQEGAVCSPVTTGIGPKGHCTTPGGLPQGEKECECAGAVPPPPLNLTGTWTADNGATYYLRQNGNELWWAGFSEETSACAGDLHQGLQFTNVFHGQLSGQTVTGEWADVPRGRVLNSGTLTLAVSDNQITRQSVTGGFEASLWNRTGSALPTIDIFKTFDQVKKNQNAWRDHSLLDNLKPAKGKPVAIMGSVTQAAGDPDPMHVNYWTTDGRSYNDFICLDHNDSPPDGDIDFNITVDRAALDAQVNFWSDGWETDHSVTPDNFRNKLNRQNELHLESIMYGGTTECGDDGPTSFLLPGWQQSGGAGVFLNGVPIAGQMDLTNRNTTPRSSRINSISGKQIKFGDRVRVTGILALDCGHGWTRPCYEDDASEQNQEIHPVYALDLVQNFQQPRPGASLTGVWGANDAGTYYVRQLGNTLFWLGLSVDEGRTFANVFRGTLQANQISGSWADIPLGQTANAGTLALAGDAGQLSIKWSRTGVSGGFSGQSWEKLYDVGGRSIVIVFETAVASGSLWPNTSEAFELVVGNQRVEVRPGNPQAVRTPQGQQTTQVQLGSRVAINLREGVPLRVAARFAGYRANWTMEERDFQPGVHLQSMSTPRALHLAASLAKKQDVTDRDVTSVAGRLETTQQLPQIVITYHIERAGTFR